MKKICKFSLYLIIMLLSFFALNSRVQAKTCREYTDVASCEAESVFYCVWADEIEVGKSLAGCYDSVKPTSTSKKCSAIKDSLTCILRTDCTPYENKCITMEEAEKIVDDYQNLKYGDLITKDTEPFKCSNVKYFTMLWMFIRIISPFIVILFGSLDFFKSMIASDEKGMKAARGKFIKRLIAFFLLIILPFVIQFIFSTIGTYGSQNICMVKCITTNDTSAKGCGK